MDPTRPPHATHTPGFPSENRVQSPPVPGSVAQADPCTVTAGRAGGVVQPSTDPLLYEVDSPGHRVVARYQNGQIAFAFGGFGQRPGQFDTPLDIVTIRPEFSGEPHLDPTTASLFSPWLAVADYGNHRIQFFECDGTWVGESDLEPGQPPCQLAWRAPALEITTLDGRLLRLHVAASLLAASRRDDRHEEAPVHRDPRNVWRVC